MAQTIKLKRSATAGNTPTTSQLALGELGINTTDGKLFLKKSVSGTESIVDVGDTSGYLPLSGGTLTGNLNLGDNVKATFGGSNDLALWHDGANSRILDAGTGFLAIGTNGTEIRLTGQSFDEFMAKFEQDGPVTLYHNHSPKIATTSTGIDVTGNIDLPDNGKLLLGASDDLQLYHDGSNSYVKDVGTGTLNLQGSTQVLIAGANGTVGVQFVEGAGVNLRHNNVQKLYTTSTGIDVTGTITADGLTVDQSSDTTAKLTINNTTSRSTAIGYTGTYQLDIGASGTNDNVRYGVFSNGGATASILTNAVTRALFASNGDISFYNDSAAQGFFWDSSTSRLGLGVTNPAQSLHLTSTGFAYARLNNSSYTGIDIGQHTNGNTYFNLRDNKAQVFLTNNTERLKINADGSSVFSGSVTADGLTVDGSGTIASFKRDAGANGQLDLSFPAQKPTFDVSSDFFIKHQTNQILAVKATGIEVTGSVTAQKLTLTKAPVGTFTIEVDGTNTGQPNLIVKQSTSERLRIDNQGRVGIGTSSPSAKVDLVGGDVTGGLKISADKTNSAFFAFGADANETRITSTSYGGYKPLTVHTGGAERMRIDSSGNVGIGTSSFTSAATGRTVLEVNGASASALINLSVNGTRQGYIYADTTDMNIYNVDNGSLNFGTNNTERMRIRADGEVEISGIGNTTGARLNVGSDASNAFVRSYDTAQGFIVGTANATPFKVMTNSTERMRIDSSGNLLVGSSSTPSGSTDGTVIFASGTIASYRTGAPPAVFSRNASNGGEVVVIQQQGTTVGSIGTSSGYTKITSGDGTNGSGLQFGDSKIYPVEANSVVTDNAVDLGDSNYRFKDFHLSGTVNAPYIGATDTGLYFNGSYNAVVPYRPDTDAAVDDYLDLGMYSYRFDDVFATNGTIQTSDRNEKQDIEFLTEAEERVAVACKGLLKKFRWKSSVAEKGDDARIHFGIIAQDLQAAFEAEGLDAGRYAMFTSDTWTDKDGEEQTRMGVRYSELLAFIISAI